MNDHISSPLLVAAGALLLALVVLPLAAGCGASQSENPGAATTAAQTPDGEAIYKKYCIACHGSAGDMGMNGAANLQQSKLTLEERVQVIRDGRNMMTPFKDLLSEAEIEAVAKYTMKFSQGQ